MGHCARFNWIANWVATSGFFLSIFACIKGIDTFRPIVVQSVTEPTL